MSAATERPPEQPWESLLEFVEELRPDYEYGVDEVIAVQELLLALAARGELPDDLARLEGYLAPILCSNRQEQQDFPHRYRSWLRREKDPVPQEVAFEAATDRALTWQNLRSWNVRAGLVLGALVAFAAIALIAWAVQGIRGKTPTSNEPSAKPVASAPATPAFEEEPNAPPGPPPTPDADNPFTGPPSPVDARFRPELLQLAAGLLGTSLVVFLGIAWWRRRSAERFLSRGGERQVPGAETLLFGLESDSLEASSELVQAAAALRRRAPTTVTDLDVAGSVRESARQAGSFTEVRKRRSVVPEYLFLIERRSRFDLESARIDDLLDILVQSGVHVRRYYFDRDPSVVFQREPGARPLLLGELESAFPTHRLGVFADPAILHDGLDGTLPRSTEDLLAWHDPILFTPLVSDREHVRTSSLRAHGFRVHFASARGLVEAWGDLAHADLKIADADATAPVPRLFIREARECLARVAPEPTWLERCVAQLRQYLGPEGFRWLAASAMYPQFRWPLSVELVRDPKLLPAGPRLSTARKLLRLPWARAAHLPNWLRLRLLRELRPQEHTRVQRRLERLLVEVAYRVPGEKRLEISRDDAGLIRELYRRLLKRWKKDRDEAFPGNDRVFASAMRTNLAVSFPRALRSWGEAAKQRTEAVLPERDWAQHAYGTTLVAMALGAASPSGWRWLFGCLAVSFAFLASPPALLRIRGVAAKMAQTMAICIAVFIAVSDPLWLAFAGAVFVIVGLVLASIRQETARFYAVYAGAFALFLLFLAVSDAYKYVDDLELKETIEDFGTAFAILGILTLPLALKLAGAVIEWYLANSLVVAPGPLLRFGRSLDAWAPDRLLLDTHSRPLPFPGRARTALLAAAVGIVFGAGLSAKTLGLGTIVALVGWIPFVAYPYCTVMRLRANGERPALRSGYEYALATLVTLAVWQPTDTNDSRVLLALSAANWLLPVTIEYLWRAKDDPRAKLLDQLGATFDRIAPDRALGTVPRILGVVYVGLFVLSLFAWAPESALARIPELWRATPVDHSPDSNLKKRVPAKGPTDRASTEVSASSRAAEPAPVPREAATPPAATPAAPPKPVSTVMCPEFRSALEAAWLETLALPDGIKEWNANLLRITEGREDLKDGDGGTKVYYPWVGDWITYHLYQAGSRNGLALNRVQLNRTWRPGSTIAWLCAWAGCPAVAENTLTVDRFRNDPTSGFFRGGRKSWHAWNNDTDACTDGYSPSLGDLLMVSKTGSRVEFFIKRVGRVITVSAGELSDGTAKIGPRSLDTYEVLGVIDVCGLRPPNEGESESAQ